LATLRELQVHLGTLATILWNYGASFPDPTLDRYADTGNLGFVFTAELPGSQQPRAATVRMAELWQRDGRDAYRRREYAYDFVEHPLARRRAFHGHDPDHFAREFRVLVHEHCEEALGRPTCQHYYGLPVDPYEAIRRFASLWGQPGPLRCADLQCMSS
jgi:hypothetical protein